MTAYLYDKHGDVIAFRRSWDDRHVYDIDGHWAGWLPWEGCDVVDASGAYLGTVVADRLVRRNDGATRRCDATVEHPERAQPTGRPTGPLGLDHLFAYEDVRLPHVV